MSVAFERYIGIDYSGAETCESSLKGLRVYAADSSNEASEVAPPAGLRWYWSRKEIAHWLVERLMEPPATLVGIDHGFSFPKPGNLPLAQRYLNEMNTLGLLAKRVGELNPSRCSGCA
jgi:hypothetical protein